MTNKIIKALYHYSEFTNTVAQLTNKQRQELVNDIAFKNIDREFNKQFSDLKKKRKTTKEIGGIEKYDFELIMNEIRNMLIHKKITSITDFTSIAWLLKILLKNPTLFKSVNEVNIFLANVTGLKHHTKSTGRDRIVDWYFKEMNKQYSKPKRNQILEKILKYIFVTHSANHKEWTELLLNIKG